MAKAVLLALALAACGAPAHLSEVVPAGDACPDGGLLIEHGNDSNGNGKLDPDEIETTQTLCNGAPGGSGADERTSSSR